MLAAGEPLGLCCYAHAGGGLVSRVYRPHPMHAVAHALYAFFTRLGGLGLFTLGVLDSSFLVMPLGKDLLMVVLTIKARGHMLYYAAMAAAGSVLGCLLVDLIFRKAGEKGLEKHLSPKRLEYVKKKVKGKAAVALIVACLAPPPFPFTPFIMAASALQYPRRRMLLVIGAARLVRYLIVGWLSLEFGKRILKWADSGVVQAVVVGLVVLSIVASVVSVVRWIKRSRNSPVYTEAV
jgi:membrane protein YqaA with SNARE-associated domain